jgi:hypothetical protein
MHSPLRRAECHNREQCGQAAGCRSGPAGHGGYRHLFSGPQRSAPARGRGSRSNRRKQRMSLTCGEVAWTADQPSRTTRSATAPSHLWDKSASRAASTRARRPPRNNLHPREPLVLTRIAGLVDVLADPPALGDSNAKPGDERKPPRPVTTPPSTTPCVSAAREWTSSVVDMAASREPGVVGGPCAGIRRHVARSAWCTLLPIAHDIRRRLGYETPVARTLPGTIIMTLR